MPMPNEHSARIKAPIPSNAAKTTRKLISPGISIILQKAKGDTGPMKTQSYRFNKKQFTPEQAKAWLSQHKIKPILFEPASEPEDNPESRGDMMNRISKELGNAVI